MTLTDTMQDRTQSEAAARQRFTEMFTRDGFIQATVLLAIAIALIGVFTNAEIKNFGGAFHEFYANISSELLSILITVLIIERFNARRQDKQELTRLKALLRSNEAVVTKIAVAELRARGWLEDGSLHRAHLRNANLEGANLNQVNLLGADLIDANLSGAKLSDTNMSRANLFIANLSGAHLSGANLSGAHLYEANLEGTTIMNANLAFANLNVANLTDAFLWQANLTCANLIGANLRGAYLIDANLSGAVLEDATLPNGTKWTPETDMARFTDPNHPNFWNPDEQSS